MILRGCTLWRLDRLAGALGLEFRGRPETEVRGAAELAGAGETDLSALFDPRWKGAALSSRAGVLVVSPEMVQDFGERPLLVSRYPRADFARAIDLICPEPVSVPGIHPTVQMGLEVQIGTGVWVGAGSLISDRCKIGNRVRIGPGCVVLDEVELAEDVVIHPRVVLYPRTSIGARSVVLAGAVIGSPGFGFAPSPSGPVRVPHLGRVVIEPDVEIGANTTVDRATFGETRIGAGTKLDNLVQVAHNVEIGPQVLMASQSGLSGSSRLGRGVVVGGQSGLADHVSVGDGGIVAAKTAVFSDVGPGEAVAGIPAGPAARWRRIAALQNRLPEMWRALRSLTSGQERSEE